MRPSSWWLDPGLADSKSQSGHQALPSSGDVSGPSADAICVGTRLILGCVTHVEANLLFRDKILQYCTYDNLLQVTRQDVARKAPTLLDLLKR